MSTVDPQKIHDPVSVSNMLGFCRNANAGPTVPTLDPILSRKRPKGSDWSYPALVDTRPASLIGCPGLVWTGDAKMTVTTLRIIKIRYARICSVLNNGDLAD